MSGISPLRYETVTHFALLSGNRVTPLDVEGLMALDAALRHRSEGESGG